MEVFLKVSTIENTVRSGLRVVNDEFVLDSRSFGSSGFGLKGKPV